jgi:tripartite ATP-independent transporter DctM subunit
MVPRTDYLRVAFLDSFYPLLPRGYHGLLAKKTYNLGSSERGEEFMWMILMVSIFLSLLLSGSPVILALILPSAIYIIFSGAQLSTLTANMISAINKWQLVAIPLFVLMGTLIKALKINEVIIRFTRAIYRDRPGWSLKLSVVINLILAGMSGSAMADLGALGLFEVQAAESEGYKRSFASALAIATCILGPTFPPSIPLIVYAMAAQVSSVRCLLAGVFPALVIAAFLYIYVIFEIPRRRTESKQILQKISRQPPRFLPPLLHALPVLFMPLGVVYSMVSGIFSPTECGGVAALFIFLLGLYYRTLSLGRIGQAITDALSTTCSILFVCACGLVFSNILVAEGLADFITKALLTISDKPLVILLVINLIVFILGCLIDGITIILLIIPIIMPVIRMLNIDPIFLGIILTLSVNIGLMTPPFGMGLFVMAVIGETSMASIIKDEIPLIIVMILSLLFLTFFPVISVWFPNMFFGKM